MSTDRKARSINLVTNPIFSALLRWRDLLILFINPVLLLFYSLASSPPVSCVDEPIPACLHLPLVVVVFVTFSGYSLWNSQRSVWRCAQQLGGPWEGACGGEGKTVIRSDVIVCGLNTSSHVSCHETRKRLCVDQCGSSSLMTLCAGLMNNLDGITPALVALQLLPFVFRLPPDVTQDIIDLGQLYFAHGVIIKGLSARWSIRRR